MRSAHPLLVLLLLLPLMLLPLETGAETLVGAHSGATDPVTEGWVLDHAGPGTSSGPSNDGGVPVWSIHDDSTVHESAHWYRLELTPAERTIALTSGWRVRVRLRAVNDAGAGETQFMGFVTGSVAFQVHFRAEVNGDLTARVVEGYPPFSGPTFTVPGGALAYHTYELASDGASGLASLSIDGLVVHSGYDGLPFGSPYGARFGCGTSAASGTIHVESAALWIGPVGPVSAGDPVETASWGRVKATFR